MTRKQFEVLTREIQTQELKIEFRGNPLAYGERRAELKQERLAKLLSLARKVKGSKSVERKADRWQRQLLRMANSQRRFAQIKGDSIVS